MAVRAQCVVLTTNFLILMKCLKSLSPVLHFMLKSFDFQLKQTTGFYMKCNSRLKWGNPLNYSPKLCSSIVQHVSDTLNYIDKKFFLGNEWKYIFFVHIHICWNIEINKCVKQHPALMIKSHVIKYIQLIPFYNLR